MASPAFSNLVVPRGFLMSILIQTQAAAIVSQLGAQGACNDSEGSSDRVSRCFIVEPVIVGVGGQAQTGVVGSIQRPNPLLTGSNFK